MQGLTIYKASAGSGKTYTLTLEYLRQALRDPFNANSFRGMLAVTFTNKATEEMKDRILITLNNLAEGRAGAIAKQLQFEMNLTSSELQKRAKRVQTAILHNYSRFAISTIDKFFQKIIHAFVREAGLRPGFTLELDHTRLLEEAIDCLMINLHNKPLVYEWVIRAVDERLERGLAWDIRRPLLEKGSLVFSETFREFGPTFYQQINNAHLMQQYLQQLQKIVRTLDETMKGIASMALDDMREVGIEVSDFPYGRSSFASYFHKVLKGEYEPGARVLQALYNPEYWTNKSMSPSMRYSIEGLFPMLNNHLVQLVETYKLHKLDYNTSKLILNNFRLLGLLGEIEKQVKKVANTDNLMPIAETSYLLSQLIDQSDTPFVYERTGNRYHSYMIDEFQDTSAAQWRNFKPLLSNSLSQGQFCMVVGDVKQSIYRWRNGDWRILAHQLSEDFEQFGCRMKNLETNWRSKPVVVGFNNSLFKHLPIVLAQQLAADCELDETQMPLADAYKDAKQIIPLHSLANGGYVNLSAYYANDEQTATAQILEHLPKLMIELQDRGYAANDIAVLVRRAQEGQWVSDCLLEYKRTANDTMHCFDVVSQDTLFIARSEAVQLGMALLRALVNPSDEVNNAFINNSLQSRKASEGKSYIPCFDSTLNPAVSTFLADLAQLSLPEVFEQIVSHFELASCPDDLPFVQELHDELLQYARNELSDVSAFLAWWDERGHNIKLTPGKSPNAINILTIHKSKGLQYPVVVVPFCNWSLKPHADTIIWASPQTAPFDQLSYVPVNYGSMLRNSHFSANYVQETIHSVVDNTNLLYVAFTRPEEELHVMLPLSKTDQETMNQNHEGAAQNIAQTLHAVLGWNKADGAFDYVGARGYKKGHHIHFGSPQSKKQSIAKQKNELLMRAYPTGRNKRMKLLIRYESDNYFPETISTPIQYRNYGTLMHRVFARITTVDDISSAVDQFITEGWIEESNRQQLEYKVHKALQNPQVASWFQDDWQVKSEQFLLLPPDMQVRHGISRRPDRVMMRENTTVVIDYKFGAHQQTNYDRQVRSYVNLLREMGYPQVTGYVWYVDLEKIEQID